MPSYTVTKPHWFSSTQELRENGRIVGELTMIKKFSYALAEARMPDRTVRFGYKGWNTRSLFIQDPAGNEIATTKRLSWWSRDATVTIGDKTYTWKQKNWWGTRCGWFGPDGREIMEVRMRWWGKLDVTAPTPPDKTAMFLLFFGMYLMKLYEMEAASAGV